MSRFLAIDTDAGGLLVVSGFAKGDTVRTEQVVAAFDDPRPLSAATAQDLAKRLKAVLAEHRIAPAPVLLCLGRDRVIFKEIKHPKTAPVDEPAIVKFQAQRDLTESPEDVHMDYVPVPTKEDEECRATVVFVRKDLYDAAKTLCEEAGLKLAGVMPRPFAAVAAAREAVAASVVPPLDDPQHGSVAVLSVWDGGGEFVVAHHDRLLFSRSVSASALNSEAALVGETKRSIAAFASHFAKTPIQALYLAEGHSGGGSWAARLQASLPVPVYPFDPLHAAPANVVPPHLRGRFVGPIGLIAARGKGALPINFVAPRQPRAEPNKLRSRIILGVLLLAGIAGVLAAGSWFLNKELDKKLDEQAKLKKVVEDQLKAQQTDTNRLKAADEFRARDVCWLDVLYDMTVLYPDIDKMRLKEFDARIPDPKVETKKPGQPAAGAAKLPLPGSTLPTGGVRPASAGTATAVKAPDKKAPGTLTMTVLAPDHKLPDRLKEQMILDDKSYRNPSIKFGTPGSSGQEFTVFAEVFKRKPTEYTRVLDAKFPVVMRKPDPVIEPEGDDQ